MYCKGDVTYRHQHALAFHDRSTAAKEPDDKHENSGRDEQNCGTQHVIGGCQ